MIIFSHEGTEEVDGRTRRDVSFINYRRLSQEENFKNNFIKIFGSLDLSDLCNIHTFSIVWKYTSYTTKFIILFSVF